MRSLEIGRATHLSHPLRVVSNASGGTAHAGMQCRAVNICRVMAVAVAVAVGAATKSLRDQKEGQQRHQDSDLSSCGGGLVWHRAGDWARLANCRMRRLRVKMPSTTTVTLSCINSR